MITNHILPNIHVPNISLTTWMRSSRGHGAQQPLFFFLPCLPPHVLSMIPHRRRSSSLPANLPCITTCGIEEGPRPPSRSHQRCQTISTASPAARTSGSTLGTRQSSVTAALVADRSCTSAASRRAELRRHVCTWPEQHHAGACVKGGGRKEF
jgi:hypothetical protein